MCWLSHKMKKNEKKMKKMKKMKKNDKMTKIKTQIKNYLLLVK